MPVQIKAPNGDIINFPDGTSDATIEAAMAKEYPSSVKAPAPLSFAGKVKDVIKSGATGLAEGALGLIGLPGTISDISNSALTKAINYATGSNVELPKSPFSGDVLNAQLAKALGGYHAPQSVAGEYARTIGQFAPGMVVGPEGVIPRIASAVIPAVASEAAGQATKGTTAEPAARIAGALLAPIGIGIAKRAGTSLAQALSGSAKPSIVDEIAPTAGQWKQAGGSLYEEVFKDPNKNVIISKESLADLSKKVKNIATDFGYKPKLNPKATAVINDVLSLPQSNSTLMGLEMTKRIAGNVAKDYGTADGALAGKIHAAITDFMDDLADKDIIGTEATGVKDLSGIGTLKTASDAWKTYKKAMIIQNIQDNAAIKGAANYTQAGTEQALQRGFANLAANVKKMAQFTPEEQNAIKLAAKGTAVQGALKLLGKMAIRGPVSAGATTVLGHLIGPAGPYMLAGIGEAAKQGAASGTEANVQALSALVRGGPEAVQKLKAARTAALLNQLKSYSAPAAGIAGYAAQPALASGQ